MDAEADCSTETSTSYNPQHQEQTSSLDLIYQYQRLADTEIRVLVLLPGKFDDPVQCRLEHISLQEKVKYETISYAWGDPNLQSTIESEGKSIQIPVNLHSAFRHLRYENDERVIWADAVCINQHDLDERSSQVLLMGKVYAQAQQVIVWIGEETEDVGGSIEQFEKLHRFLLENEPGYPNQPDRWHTNPLGGSPVSHTLIAKEDEWRIPIANLAKRSWFVRRWVLQEVAKSPAAIVVCGKRQISWITMADVIWSLHKAGLLHQFFMLPDPGPIRAGVQSIILIELVRRDVLLTKGSKLLELIISVRNHKCLDPRDVIYSALGVACDLDTFNAPSLSTSHLDSQEPRFFSRLQPDYTSSVEKVYHNFVLAHILTKRSLLPLSANYIPPSPPDNPLSLPSWVPDFSRLSEANPLMHLRNESALPFKASKGSTLKVRFSNDHKTMHITGRLIDTIQSVAREQEAIILPSDLEEQSKAESWDTEKIMTAKLKLWIMDSLQIYDFKLGEPGTLFGLSAERFDEFAKTLVCNLTASGDVPSPEFTLMVLEYFAVVFDGADAAIAKYVKDGDWKTFAGRLMIVEGAMYLRVSGWCFAATESGRMGRVLSSVQKGDSVVLLGGGEVPYVLRKREGRGWTFVGSCYMHGLMEGEGMGLTVADEEFDIY